MKRAIWFPISLMIVLTILSGYGGQADASEIAGVNLPDNLDIGGKTYNLAATGVRKKLFVKVYAAGFYLEEATGLNELISTDQTKAILMHFIYRKVTAEKLNKAWKEGFTANTPEAKPDLKKRMGDFITLFKEDVVRGDRIILTYQPGQGTTVTFNDQQLGTIAGHDFNQALMKVWFGEIPADQGLKRSVADGLDR